MTGDLSTILDARRGRAFVHLSSLAAACTLMSRLIASALALLAIGSADVVPAAHEGPMPFSNITRLTMMAVSIVSPPTPDGEYSLVLNSSNVTRSNFDAVHRCAKSTAGAAGKPIEQLITLGLDIPVWTRIANEDLDRFAPAAVNFLQDHDLDGMNFVRNRALRPSSAFRLFLVTVALCPTYNGGCASTGGHRTGRITWTPKST